jgi:hypothetical protein
MEKRSRSAACQLDGAVEIVSVDPFSNVRSTFAVSKGSTVSGFHTGESKRTHWCSGWVLHRVQNNIMITPNLRLDQTRALKVVIHQLSLRRGHRTITAQRERINVKTRLHTPTTSLGTTSAPSAPKKIYKLK